MKTTLISIGLSLALVLGVFNLVKTYVPASIPQIVGAVAGPDFYFDYMNFNGVRASYTSTGFITSTTTVCAIKSPAATSTLSFGSAQFTTSSTTASIVTLARAATPYATTTAIGWGSISAASQGYAVASSSPTTANALVFSPNTYFVVGMQGNVGTFSPVGTCKAVFTELQ